MITMPPKDAWPVRFRSLGRLVVARARAHDELGDRESDHVDPEQDERTLHADDDDGEHRPERDQEHVEKPAHARRHDADNGEDADDAEDERAEQDAQRPGWQLPLDVGDLRIEEGIALQRRAVPPPSPLVPPLPSSWATIASTPSVTPPSKSPALNLGAIRLRMIREASTSGNAPSSP